MASPFRKNAVQARANSSESRARTSLVTPRRALVALAIIAMLVAGLLYVAVTSLTTPIMGVGWSDRGGFITVTSPAAGEVSAPKMATGTLIRKGEKYAVLKTPDGKTIDLTAPEDAIVMQHGSLSETNTVKEGDPIVTLGLMSRPATLVLVLPGIEATGFTAGKLSKGAAVWVRPANGSSFQCTLVAYNAYEQSGESIVAYVPSPTVARFVRSNGSVVAAVAKCPKESLDRLLVGQPVPVSVDAGQRSLLSFVFGES